MTNRMRTVNTAYEELICDDPNTAVTKNAIRQIVNSGKIPSLRFGNRTVFDLDDLEKYLLTVGKSDTVNKSNEGCII